MCVLLLFSGNRTLQLPTITMEDQTTPVAVAVAKAAVAKAAVRIFLAEESGLAAASQGESEEGTPVRLALVGTARLHLLLIRMGRSKDGGRGRGRGADWWRK